MNPKKTAHSPPSRVSSNMSLVGNLEKMDRVITAPHSYFIPSGRRRRVSLGSPFGSDISWDDPKIERKPTPTECCRYRVVSDAHPATVREEEKYKLLIPFVSKWWSQDEQHNLPSSVTTSTIPNPIASEQPLIESTRGQGMGKHHTNIISETRKTFSETRRPIF